MLAPALLLALQIAGAPPTPVRSRVIELPAGGSCWVALPEGQEVSLPSGTPAKFWLEPKFSRVILQAPLAGAADACPVFAEFAGDASSVVGPPPTDSLGCTVRWQGGVPELVVDLGGQCVLHVPHVARIAI